jgi:hypothetical protein
MNLHQWAPSQVHVKQYECPVDKEDPLSKSRLAPIKSKYLLTKAVVRFQMGPDSIGKYGTGIKDPTHFNLDPDSTFQFHTDTDPDPDPDPDPAPRPSDGNLRPLVCRPTRASFLTSRPPLEIQVFAESRFNANPDSIRIRIR